MEIDGVWVPNMAPKQFEVFNNYKKFLLVSGPRKSSKTFAVLHRLVRHAWEVPGARIGVFTKTVRNAKSGSWRTLYDIMIPEWCDNLEGFELVKPMSIDGSTRMEYFRVSNSHGGVSEFQLHSLKVDSEIAEKVKGTVFSCTYVSELTAFKTPKVLKILSDQLRMPGVPYDMHQWISDTNPDEDLGQDSWVYKAFYDRPDDDEPRTVSDDIEEMSDEEVEERELRAFERSQMQVIEFQIKDNTYLDPREVIELKSKYRGDPDLYASMVDGTWVATSRGSIFSGIFNQQRHVVGNKEDPDPDNWDVIVPQESTGHLVTGWDLGDSNHSFHIMEICPGDDGSVVNVLDELHMVNTNTSISDFTALAIEKMDWWESAMDKKYYWIHWSDASAVDRFRATSGTWDAQVVARASGGRIELRPTPKFANSQRLRIMLTKQLLIKNKLNISVKCPALIKSLAIGLKRGRYNANTFIRNNYAKHSFDSCTYPIQAELHMEIQVGAGARTDQLTSELLTAVR